MDEIIEMQKENIDVENIMKKLKENVRKRKETGLFRENSFNICGNPLERYNASYDLSYICNKDFIKNNSYIINSHRFLIGRFLIKGRNIINGEVRRYVDPMFDMQSEWNAAAARIIKEHDIHFSEINDRIKRIENQLQSISDISEQENEYFKELTGSASMNLINHHNDYINLIKKYALTSAGKSTPKIIEIGLKNGAISLHLSRDHNLHVYGIDRSVNVLNKAYKNNEFFNGSVKIMLIDPLELEIFKEKYFDVAFSFEMLEDFDDETIIKSLLNQLSIANHVLFSVRSNNYSQSIKKGNERKRSKEQWYKLLKTADINIIRLEYYSDYYIMGIICK